MNRGIPSVHPEALHEIKTARRWYAEHNRDIADGFMAELKEVFEKIAAAPHRYPQYIGKTPFVQLRRFPHLVVYRLAETDIEIVAVSHAKRQPGYWIGR